MIDIRYIWILHYKKKIAETLPSLCYTAKSLISVSNFRFWHLAHISLSLSCIKDNHESITEDGKITFRNCSQSSVQKNSAGVQVSPVHWHCSNLISYSSNSGVEKYRSAVSGRTVTTVLPSPSFFASFRAAATLVPEDMPHMIPSLAASSFYTRMASSSVTIQISS